MAAIGKIRKHSILCMVIIGVALLAFIIGDFSKKSNRDLSNTPVGIVNGEKILAKDFDSEVDKVATMRSANTDQSELSKMMFSIRQSVWNDMVKQTLLNDEYDKLGVIISTEELNDLVRGPEPHQYIVQNFSDPETGKVNYEQLNYFLQNLNNPQVISADIKNNYLLIEQMIKQESAEGKYNNLITKGIYTPKAMALREHNDKYTNYGVQLVAQRYKDIPDSIVSASDAEYQKYYNSHKESYKVAETRDLAYIEYDIKPTQEDRDAITKIINNLYADFLVSTNIPAFVSSESEVAYSDRWMKEADLTPSMASRVMSAEPNTFVSPFTESGKLSFAKVMDAATRHDSLNASHILISYVGAQSAAADVTRTKEQAKATADSIANVVKKTPAKFGELATSMSNDAGSAPKNGELGWFTDGTMVVPFNDFVVENKVGTIGVVETIFGYHVIKVDDKAAEMPKVKLAVVTRSILPSSKTYSDAYLQMSSAVANCKNYDVFSTMAAEKGYNLKNADGTDKMAQNLGSIENSREVVKWAFNEDTKEGQVSKIYELEDKLIVVAVKSINKEGYRPFDKVLATIKPLVLRDKKADMAAKKIEEAMNNASSISQLASVLRTTVDSLDVTGNISNLTKYGAEPEVIGFMFAAPENQIVGAVKGEQAAYAFVKKLKSSPEEKTDFTADQRRLEMQTANRVTRRAVATIQENAKITDNRFLFY
ncbi:MAG: peptidylprolyl isomerase [Bacteroidales bacterium]|nr:peptidylprolyl isomerase [Bacteroidales bacterium]MDD2204408.1 peptidylprolyl isomerase [Bacteroidales bacterium]MDD3152269.1 peptidylprolyl isomerase [Bacteroidales bacterium]MDD3913820.1 peptidylprolyl isomerase [Bacteroidales bacterium]MDD4634319.1 peptidylprolyl isomerase [Bacteroidales bacterium]